MTLLGGVLWIAALVVAINGPIVVDEWGTYRDGMAAMPLFFAAIMLLGVGMIAVALRLPEPASIPRAAAYVASMAGLLWAFAPWFMWAGVVAFAGLLVVGCGAWRAGHWSPLELGTLVTGVGLGWGLVLTGASGLWGPPTPNPDIQYVVLALFVSAWVVVGASLARAPHRRATLAPPDA
ncbi:MAG: hypothetical protein A2Z32_06705 [Chloroflexi bacterium RBG_16_69_14]|nr:MAG: hypothetical protein A2Z32_06705 [Chloroflexi bacterium RBG_16_69_14]